MRVRVRLSLPFRRLTKLTIYFATRDNDHHEKVEVDGNRAFGHALCIQSSWKSVRNLFYGFCVETCRS